MRNGFILLHRKGIDADEWKHPLRTLAWIDLCTMAAWDDYTAEDGVQLKRGEVIASYGFLAQRWKRSKSRVHEWITTWIAERQLERRAERCTERNAERFFLLNYAKYQEIPERVAERSPERLGERGAEPIERKEGNEDSETPGRDKEITKWFRQHDIRLPDAYLAKIKKECPDQAIDRAWADAKRGVGINSPADFFARCRHYSGQQ